MAKTFEQIKTAIQDWLGTNEKRLPAAVRGDIINLVQRQILREQELAFGEISDTFPTVDGTRDYTVPDTWIHPHTLWYLDAETNTVAFLTYLDKERFDLNFPDSAKKGKPSAYTVWGNKIQLGKTPDRVLTVNRNYYGLLADLVDGGPTNENEFTKKAWEVLFYGSLVEAERFGIEDPRIPMWTGRYKELLDGLVIAHARARTSGRRGQSEEPS